MTKGNVLYNARHSDITIRGKDMKVFLSWSDTRSKETAETLRRWLKLVIQAVDPWISSSIPKGVRSEKELAEVLEDTKVGIICLTRENLDSNWIHFEAGALSKTSDAHVCTFLLDLKPTDIKPPLAQFQHTQFEKEEIHELVRTINKTLEKVQESPLDEKTLDTTFVHFWPELEKNLRNIIAKPPNEDHPVRSETDMLEEILSILRGQTENTYNPFGIEPEARAEASITPRGRNERGARGFPP